MSKFRILILMAIITAVSLSCSITPNIFGSLEPTSTVVPTPTQLPSQPILPGAENPDEPVFLFYFLRLFADSSSFPA